MAEFTAETSEILASLTPTPSAQEYLDKVRPALQSARDRLTNLEATKDEKVAELIASLDAEAEGIRAEVTRLETAQSELEGALNEQVG